MILFSIFILFIIFVINVIPAFMPPTWMLISFVGFNFRLSNLSLIILSILAAIVATCGRMVLAHLSNRILRNKVLKDTTRANIDVLKNNLEKRKSFTFGFFLLYAFSPFPSGQLFLAYGLTNLKLRLAAIPFFVGRLFSYILWALTASGVSKFVDTSALRSGAFVSSYFIIGQIFAFYLVYLFVKIDWHVLFEKHKIRLLKK